MAEMNDIVKLAVDAYRGRVEKYSENQSMDVLRQALVEANGGSTVLDYKKIREEASALWRELVERDPENAPIILKKVEMIFGRPMKLSEITEDQVDLFNLVVLDMKDML